MIEIRASRAEEVPSQKELWKLAFGDEDRYIDYFYKHNYKPENMLVLLEDGVLRTMLDLFPMTLVNPAGERASAFYVYALATDPTARKKGFGRELVHYADLYLKEQGTDCLTVVPAEPSLHKFFASAGFDECFATRKLEVLGHMIGPAGAAAATPVEPAEYRRIRSRLLAGERYVDYDDAIFDYQRDLSRMAGADLYRVVVNGVEGCAAAEYADGDSVLLKELVIPEKQMSQALSSLAELLPATRYHVRTPAFVSGLPGSYVQEFGMVKWYHKARQEAWGRDTGGYMGFAFD